MATCAICGMAACGLASHKKMVKALGVVDWVNKQQAQNAKTEARENLEIVTSLVQKRLPNVRREQIISKALELDPAFFYEPDGPEAIAKADQLDQEQRDLFVDVERLADQLQVSNRSLTRAQAVAQALELRQDIYDRSVLMAADNVPVQRESAR